MNRDRVVNVRFTEEGVKVIDSKRHRMPRGEFIRKAVAYAIKMGFTVPKDEF